MLKATASRLPNSTSRSGLIGMQAATCPAQRRRGEATETGRASQLDLTIRVVADFTQDSTADASEVAQLIDCSVEFILRHRRSSPRESGAAPFLGGPPGRQSVGHSNMNIRKYAPELCPDEQVERR